LDSSSADTVGNRTLSKLRAIEDQAIKTAGVMDRVFSGHGGGAGASSMAAGGRFNGRSASATASAAPGGLTDAQHNALIDRWLNKDRKANQKAADNADRSAKQKVASEDRAAAQREAIIDRIMRKDQKASQRAADVAEKAAQKKAAAEQKAAERAASRRRSSASPTRPRARWRGR
jgi:hypothetical protein